MVGLQTLDLAIGVRVPASQPIKSRVNSAIIIPLLLSTAMRGIDFISCTSNRCGYL